VLILLFSAAGDLRSQAGVGSLDYAAIYGERYEDAIRFIKNNPWMADSLRSYGMNPDWVLSIVFPELIRYSSIKDQIETSALFTLYVQYGHNYADFSIGPFQMKPTFAERLEIEFKLLKNRPEYSLGWAFDTGDGSRQRKARVMRLSSIQWQLRYLQMMVVVLDKRFESIRWTNAAEKLEFYASAYNSGFYRTYKEISLASEQESFHTALLIPEKRNCYASIAKEYYQNQLEIHR
jgi:hypothetical protein